MKYFLLTTTFFIFFISSKKTSAQGSYTGCFLSSNNIVYTAEYQSTGYFSSRQGVTPLTSNYCYWNQTATSMVSCTVCTGPNSVTYDPSTGAFQNCDGPVVGLRGTFMMIACPLDDYSWILVSILSIVGFSILKKKLNILSYMSLS